MKCNARDVSACASPEGPGYVCVCVCVSAGGCVCIQVECVITG